MLSDVVPILQGDILVIDDAPDNLRVLSELLTAQEYRVRQAIRGDQALVSAQLSPPDLILLDIMMPELDGFEVCRRLKGDDRTRNIPVIFLSVMDHGLDKAKAFEVGGVDYICKPFQAAEVLVRVAHQIQTSRLQKQLQEQSQHLRLQNLQLQQEVRDRIAAEAALQALNQNLEAKVEERTQQLQAALVQEHQLNQMKSQLLATISHEFRTPLSIISMSSELMKHRLLGAEHEWSHKHFYRIENNIKRLIQVLDNATLLALIDSKSLDFKPTVVDLIEFLTKVTHQKQQLLNNQNLRVLIDTDSPIMTQCDTYLLEQALNNLISNSIRYSLTEGGIKISLKEEGGQANLQIQDSGIGVPEAEKEKIFERFYRATNANSIPGTPGAGLGLAVVREIMNLHQGTVSVSSLLNQGTIFSLCLPTVKKLL